MMFKRHNAKNAKAIETVTRTYERQLLAYVTRITGIPSSSEDIVQEVFIKMARLWKHEMAPGSHLSAWLYKVAHNEAVDHIRREKTRGQANAGHLRENPDTVFPTIGQGAPVPPPDPVDRVKRALKKLSAREKKIVILKVYENRSYQEIADITGLTTGNVGYILHGAMRKLTKLLDTQENRHDNG